MQELVDAGVIGPDETEGHPQANVITRAVGAGEEELFALDKATDVLLPGDRYLLCSDGLTKSVPEPDIAVLLGDPAGDAARHLIAAALERQVSDNVTAVVLDVLDGEADGGKVRRISCADLSPAPAAVRSIVARLPDLIRGRRVVEAPCPDFQTGAARGSPASPCRAPISRHDAGTAGFLQTPEAEYCNSRYPFRRRISRQGDELRFRRENDRFRRR